MNTNLSAVFSFNSAAVRTLAADNGEPLFSASDVCAILGYRNPWDATAKHCKEHGLAKREVIDELGRTQEMTFINEGNLYRLIIKSRKPEAEAFEQWVTKEVLPTIRKTGQYIATPYAVNPADKLTAEQADTLRGMLNEAAAKAHPNDGKKQGVMIRAGWSKLKAHFKVSYRDILQGEFTEAVSIVSRHVIDGEYLPKATVDAETAPKKIAQPVISDYLQIHINRKTHEIALGQYDAIRGIITEAVQSNLNCGATESAAHDYVDSYGDAASEVIVMNKRDVFMLARQTTGLLNCAGEALETINRLEKHIGQELYSRKQPDKYGCYGLPESLVESVISAAQERKAA